MTFPIPWTKALDGCRLSVENAKRLADDAEILQQNGRRASAFALSLDAWEELGKAVLLFVYWKQKQDISKGDWIDILCNHRKKRAAYVESADILYESTVPKSVDQLKDDLLRIAKDSGDWFNLEREVGVYVDWKRDWRSPCVLGNAAFVFPFGAEYWILCVRGCSAELENLLP